MSQTDTQRHECSTFSHVGAVSARLARPPFVQHEERKWRTGSNTFTRKVVLAPGDRRARELGRAVHPTGVRLSRQWKPVAAAPSQDPELVRLVGLSRRIERDRPMPIATKRLRTKRLAKNDVEAVVMCGRATACVYRRA